jgi:hypothetical protein
MTDPFRDSIVESMSMKETDELVKIWQAHDPEEWTETAYEVIAEILQERLGEVPAITGVVEEDVDEEGDEEDFPEYDGENSPEFYDPGKVLKLAKWIDYAIYIGFGSVALTKISQFSYYLSLIGFYFNLQQGAGQLSNLLAIITLLLDFALSCVIIYFPLKALKYILQMLMEMEFKSR